MIDMGMILYIKIVLASQPKVIGESYDECSLSHGLEGYLCHVTYYDAKFLAPSLL